MASTPEDITLLLARWRNGDSQAEATLVERVYPVLRRLAQQRLAQSGSVTLVATELAGDAYLKLAEQREGTFTNRAHFYAIAAHVIRRLLIDHLRERAAQKRGGGLMQVTLQAADDVAAAGSDSSDALDLDRLLQRLDRINRRASRLVELRYFGGLTLEETAEVIGISLPTAKRDWQFARAWLHEQLSGPPSTR
ncbi:MAG: ECF-type sigma factor [Chiayiivirga sp.]|jgi:RNA polymerase sigma factor (TIGR02999 family)|uniref:ECF-type sigma factor n=1 Tax=Chiayiivirga sp. TaxID=2041042 RepID=UPI0025B7FF80|nr:ECF-type sigma factor [Chiayiivirga sp.]MCI1710732.1 ECF-type sigma factor [Chiayiivirga sp.]MCI1728428.1 ECF-type sigma factor [Chiayiivirga sp.]